MKFINFSKDKIKKIYQNRKNYILKFKVFLYKYKYVFFMSFPFIAMDLITRIFGNDIGFFGIYRLVPNLFTILWTMLFVGTALSFKDKIGKIIYLFFNVISLAIFLTNNVYYSKTSTLFDFSLMESAKEGTPYIIDTLKSANIWVYISFVFIIALIVLGFKNIPKKDKNNNLLLIRIWVYFLTFHALTPILLGKADKDLTWSSWRNPRNIYELFNP